MSRSKKTEATELDMTGLLALKTYERPDKNRTEKNIQNIMRIVRTTNNAPSLLFFPDKNFSWMFAQPRYGVAALFILFLGLHLLDRPVSAVPPVTANLERPEPAAAIALTETNQLNTARVPGIAPAYTSLAGEAAPLSAYVK